MSKKVKIINYLISPIKLDTLLKIIIQWIESKKKKSFYICVSNVHSCIESYLSNKLRKAHNNADLAIADGRPIFWCLNLLGYKNIDHLPGYHVSNKIFEISQKKKFKIGFYGSTRKNLFNLRKKLKKKYKNLNITYKYSPPFNPLALKEKKKNYKTN